MQAVFPGSPPARALTAGNPLLWAPLATPVTLTVPGIVNIPVNSLNVVGD